MRDVLSAARLEQGRWSFYCGSSGRWGWLRSSAGESTPVCKQQVQYSQTHSVGEPAVMLFLVCSAVVMCVIAGWTQLHSDFTAFLNIYVTENKMFTLLLVKSAFFLSKTQTLLQTYCSASMISEVWNLYTDYLTLKNKTHLI